MTVVQAITKILESRNEALTIYEIFNSILDYGLYDFKAKHPISIVNAAVRRHCQGIDFPTAHPIKYFKLSGIKHGKNTYLLISDSTVEKSVVRKTTSARTSEQLPEELLLVVHEEHCNNVRFQLLDQILEKNPAFFEKLVMKLLLAMGYGYSIDSGIVTGGTNDKGIDGVIDEDRLGFDKIYIQAKRYAEENKVYVNELKEFVGSMMVDKGVFITTSSFHANAIKYAEDVERKGIKLKLIDGKQLVSLMLRHKIGITTTDTIDIYVVDTDFFQE